MTAAQPDPPARAAGPPATPTVHIAVIYDTLPAGQRAVRSCQRIANEVAGRVAVHTELWKSSALDLPAVRDAARQDLAAADVVLVASEEGAPLPERLRAFLQEWATACGGKRTAMLAYHAPPLPQEDDQQLALKLLEQMVREAGCDFLAEPSPGAGGDSVPAGWRLAGSGPRSVARWQPPVAPPVPRWGIND